MDRELQHQSSTDSVQELLLKFTLVGCSGVGKTSILAKYTNKEIPESYKVTVGAEFGSRTVEIDENTILKLQIWDTAGQESFQSLVKSFYRDAHAVFLVYNVNLKHTFEELDKWLDDIKNYADENVILVLIGNQVDKENVRQVSYEDGLNYMKEKNFHYFFETSAVQGINIELAFMEAAKLAFLNIVQEKLENIQQRNTIRLSSVDPRLKRGDSELQNSEDSCAC